MKLPPLAAVILGLLAFVPVQAADAPAKPVRQRFVPVAAGTGKGASFSALRHLPADAPGVTMMIAHAGVGDSFPVREENGAKLFDVVITTGDDDLLLVEVRHAGGVAKHELKRDGTVWVEIAAHWYSLSYPSLTVSSNDKTTSEQAMLIVNRFGH